MTLPLSPGSWTLDPVHSGVQFAVRHLGISTLRGRFAAVEATLDVGADLASSTLSATIDMASIDTGNADRDAHVRSTDFFSADVHPTMTFTSASIEPGADGVYRVTGSLSLNERTSTETLEVTFFGVQDNPFDGSTRAGFVAGGRIDRRQYGIDWQVPLDSGGVMLGHDIEITIDAQLVATAAGD